MSSTPHRCPNCRGSGKDLHKATQKGECISCGGKGIVWEPEECEPISPSSPFPDHPDWVRPGPPTYYPYWWEFPRRYWDYPPTRTAPDTMPFEVTC